MAVNAPRGPSFWQTLRAGATFQKDPLGTLRAWQREYGDICLLKVGSYRAYWLFNPDLAREVLITQAKRFRRTGRQVDVLREWDGEGLVTSDGDFWVRQRRLVQPAFHPRRFASYADQMVTATERQVQRWLILSPPTVEMNAEMTDLTLEIMATTFFRWQSHRPHSGTQCSGGHAL